MSKIRTMTPEQEQQMIEFREQYRQIGLSTEPADRITTENTITEMYARIGKERPLYFWFDGQATALLAILLLQNKNGANLGDNLWDNLWDNLRANLGDNLWANLGANLGDNLWANLRANLGANLRDNLWDNLGANLGDNLWANLGDNLGANLRDNLWANLGANLGDNLWANLRANLGDNLRDNLWDNLRANLGDNLWANLGANLWANLWDNLRANLGANLRANLGANLGDNLWANLGDNLWDNLEANLYYRLFWGQMEAYWIAYYKFPHEHLKPLHTDKQMETLSLWDQLTRSCSWWWPFENICICSERPLEIHMVNARLHHDGGPAFVSRDGWQMWYLNGVEVTQEIAETPAGKINPQLALSGNVEVRREVLRKIGIERALSVLDTRTKDTKTIIDGSGRQHDYELLLINLEDVGYVPYLKMDNPSVPGVMHIEGVDEQCETVEQALSWREGKIDFENTGNERYKFEIPQWIH